MKKTLTTIAVLTLCSTGAFCQNALRGAYFLDGYTSSYKLNPAFQNDRNFISIPIVGSFNTNTGGNVGVSTFLFPDGKGNLDPFLSENVSDSDFLSKIHDRNLFGVSENISMIAAGFRTGKLYHTLDVSVKTSADLNIPGNVFRFLKRGDNEMNFSNLGIKANSFIETSYGVSRPISNKVAFGIRAKLLMGIGTAEAKFNNAYLKANEDKWTAYSEGIIETGGAIKFQADSEGKLDFESADFNPSLIGRSFGLGVDFGLSIDLNKLMTLSFAVTDLGVINWENRMVARTPGQPWEFDGFEEVSDDSSLSDQTDDMLDELAECFNVYVDQKTEMKFRPIAPTVMAGLEISMPFFSKLSAGILGTAHIDGAYSWFEGRASANLALGKAFSMSASVAGSTYGVSSGFALNLHGKVASIFIGTDNFLPWTRVTNYFIPVENLNTSLSMGVNVSFGKYNGKLLKRG